MVQNASHKAEIATFPPGGSLLNVQKKSVLIQRTWLVLDMKQVGGKVWLFPSKGLQNKRGLLHSDKSYLRQR